MRCGLGRSVLQRSVKQMKTRFSFGKHGIDVTVPDRFACQVVTSRCAKALGDASAAINSALDHPIGCGPLAGIALGKKSAAITV